MVRFVSMFSVLLFAGIANAQMPVPDPISTPGAGKLTSAQCDGLQAGINFSNTALTIATANIAEVTSQIAESDMRIAQHQAALDAALTAGNLDAAADALLAMILEQRVRDDLQRELNELNAHKQALTQQINALLLQWLIGGCL